MALQALAHAACGDQLRALAALYKALTLAAPEGHLRVFVDEGPRWLPPRKLLFGRRQQVAAASTPRDY